MRPALILQNGTGNKHSTTTVVAATTTAVGKVYPFQVYLTPGECGLPKPSKVLLEQILTVSKERLVEKVGQLSPEKMYEVEKAIHRSLGLSW